MFLGPWDEGGPYDPSGINGTYRWLNRVWNVVLGGIETAAMADAPETRELRRWTHKTIEKVTDDIGEFRFNTMIAALMEYTNYLTRLRETGAVVDADAWAEAMQSMVLLIAPTVPHIAEELWERIGKPYSVHTQSWPGFDPALAAADEVEVPVQVNGKVRDRLMLPLDAAEAEARDRAMASASVQQHISGKEIVRVIYVPNRLINIVVKG
jgi:leucyl-tRNA synthetase